MKILKLIWLLPAINFLVGCGGQGISSDIPAVSIASRSSSLTADVNRNPGIDSDSEVVAIPQTTIGINQAELAVDSENCSPRPDNQIELSVLDRINEERANNGAPELTIQAQLTGVARKHSVSMGCKNFFGHSGPDGEGVEIRVQQSGYTYKALGEVIAAGYSSPVEVVEGWLNSDSHREIILDEIYTEIGIGYVKLPESNYVHFWTIIFGRPE